MNRKTIFSGSVFAPFALILFVIAGCETPPPPTVAEEVDPLWVRANLSYEVDGFLDARTGWIFPKELQGKLVAGQAWEYDGRVIGIEYAVFDMIPEISDKPFPVPEGAVETGTVTVAAYPAGFQLNEIAGAPSLGVIAKILGLGHGHRVEMDEFWAYHAVLEDAGYNLWKLVKLTDETASDRIFHSFLVLQKLSEEKSEGFVVTVGQVNEVYILIVNRRYVRTKEDVDVFGDWAYAVLKEVGLVATSS